MENKPKISKAEFTADVNSGMSKTQLMEKWNISSQSVKEISKTLGLTVKRAAPVKYILTDDVEETVVNKTIVATNEITTPVVEEPVVERVFEYSTTSLNN